METRAQPHQRPLCSPGQTQLHADLSERRLDQAGLRTRKPGLSLDLGPAPLASVTLAKARPLRAASVFSSVSGDRVGQPEDRSAACRSAREAPALSWVWVASWEAPSPGPC